MMTLVSSLDGLYNTEMIARNSGWGTEDKNSNLRNVMYYSEPCVRLSGLCVKLISSLLFVQVVSTQQVI